MISTHHFIAIYNRYQYQLGGVVGLLDWFVRKNTTDAVNRQEPAWQSSRSPSAGPFGRYSGDVWATEWAVRTVTGFIASNIASLPFKAYRKDANGDRSEATGSKLAGVLSRPSVLPGVTRYALFRDLLLDLLLTDRMLALLTPGPYGSPLIRRVAPMNFNVDVNGNQEPIRLNVTIDGHTTAIPLPSSAVMLSTGYETGMPIPDTIAPILAEGRALADYRRNIASNAARVPAYLYRPTDAPAWDDATRSRFARDWAQFSGDGAKAGSTILLEDGMEMRAVNGMFKPVDMDDSAARTSIACFVANLYGISPENIGFRTGTKSNIAEYKDQLWSVELAPYLIALEETLNLVLPEACGEPDLYVEANLDAKLRGTLETQYQALSTATGRPWMTTNEARRLVNRPPVPEGDELITPLNVTEGGQPSPQDGGRTQQAQEGRQ
ncbi:phage portal protein [Bifidobacterium sp. SO4]|uniref:phage portal protein n=1 Tax=Bifidobacterium sp. SO4 TaxID=2809030 RepID=UPI001BDC17F2|nr:phage portal protein [Bifidobacterium sp. SO4]MBT1171364.1 phage portal protein [Bifidobacterium sp. SO4]